MIVDGVDIESELDSSMEGIRSWEFGVSGRLCARRDDRTATFTSSLANMRVVVGLRKDGLGNICGSGFAVCGVGEDEERWQGLSISRTLSQLTELFLLFENSLSSLSRLFSSLSKLAAIFASTTLAIW